MIHFHLPFMEYWASIRDLTELFFRYSPAHSHQHKFNVASEYNFSGFRFNTQWELGSGMTYKRSSDMIFHCVCRKKIPMWIPARFALYNVDHTADSCTGITGLISLLTRKSNLAGILYLKYRPHDQCLQPPEYLLF